MDCELHTRLARAAGFFSGEGATSIARSSNGRHMPVLLIVISQVDRNELAEFQSAVGVGTINGPHMSPSKRYRFNVVQPWWNYQVRNNKAKFALAMMWPYLSDAKRVQARIALTAIENERKMKMEGPNATT